jgi:hypothetical protein
MFTTNRSIHALPGKLAAILAGLFLPLHLATDAMPCHNKAAAKSIASRTMVQCKMHHNIVPQPEG